MHERDSNGYDFGIQNCTIFRYTGVSTYEEYTTFY